ncbi:MAG: hypothetical protein EZS28_046602, partial [Streblomastix strix]
KTEFDDRLTLEIMQIRRLHNEGRNNFKDLQDMELYATDRHIRDTIQQTNQQPCNCGSQRSGDTLPQRIQLQMKQDSGDRTENERQGSKTSTRQCGRLPSGPVADVGRDLLMRCMKMRGFSIDRVNLLFK